MSENMEKAPGGRIPGNRQGGTTVPGSPRSGPSAEPCEGPNPVEELPTGSRPANATAVENEDRLVRSIINRYLGPDVHNTPQREGDNLDSEDYMSVTGLPSATPRKKRIREDESVSDSDLDGLSKGRKVLRSRIIRSDSEDNRDEAITLSDSPKELAAKARGRKSRKQKTVENRKQKLDKLDKLDESFESMRVIFTACPPRMSHEDLHNKDVDEIVMVSEGWLNDMETARFRSKKINGKFSGVLKDRIVCLRSVVKALAERIKDTGDVSYLRRRNDELSSQLRESRREELRLQAFVKEADDKIEKLNVEIAELKKEINKGSLIDRTTTTERTPPPSIKEKPEVPAKIGNIKTRTLTNRKAIPTPKKEVRDNRAVSVAESLQECDEQLAAISKCDEKIAKFEELLRQMRSDLYGSIETISERVGNTVNSMELPLRKKGIPKIIENIQLVPPRPVPSETMTMESDYHADGEGWTEVKYKRSKIMDVNNTEIAEKAVPAAGDRRNLKRPPLVASAVRRRAPRAAAVSIKSNAEGITYAEIIKRARENVNLKDLGITNPRMRRAANGGVIIEIAGPEGALKADSLASRLREVVGSSASVTRPVVKADVKISGFDDSVIKDELITIITEIGSCLASDVRIGQFRQLKNGLNMVWAQCPLSAAIKLSRKARINVGWSVARIEMMKARPVQCFKCWHFGHVRNNCNSPMDRTGYCFKCGNPDHNSYNCLSDAYCVICADLGHETAHRLGSSACLALSRRMGAKGNQY